MLDLLAKLVEAADDDALARFPSWASWVRSLDSALLGGAQSTLVAVAFLPGRLVGAAVGDSRVARISRDGVPELLSGSPGRFRLGSGSAEASPIHAACEPGDLVLLLSDGAWNPLGMAGVARAVARARLGALADLPSAILGAASRSGRWDDMTVVVGRVASDRS